jgi:hypothetical protein
VPREDLYALNECCATCAQFSTDSALGLIEWRPGHNFDHGGDLDADDIEAGIRRDWWLSYL